MHFFSGYRCSRCKTQYAPNQETHTRLKDRDNLDVALNYGGIRKNYQLEDRLS